MRKYKLSKIQSRMRSIDCEIDESCKCVQGYDLKSSGCREAAKLMIDKIGLLQEKRRRLGACFKVEST